MTRILVVTNDYPPRQGGIQAFVQSLAVRQPAGVCLFGGPFFRAHFADTLVGDV